MKYDNPPRPMSAETILALRKACWRLGIETRLTASEREEKYSTGLWVPTKSQVKRAKVSYKRLIDHGDSMMHMRPRPAGQKPVIALPARTKKLLAAHERRKEAGWIHG